ncbi:alpha-amylase family glycosyl hydrolase [Priestia megaterium]|uniref:alpha-amylase family glycosyl hydrolase n=1 Tax=Priestia megaterium TaxID=1404 RepID=UPI003175735C
MKWKRTSMLLILLLLFGSSASAQDHKDIRDEVIYSLMINRFYNGSEQNDRNVNYERSDAYYGGDLQGIAQKLGYIQEMGFTAVLLTPFVENDETGYHGYAVTDHYKIDDHFGTLKDLQNLVKKAHERNIKIMVEFPLTISNNHPWVADKEKQTWISNESGTDNEVIKALPHLNLKESAVQKYLIKNAAWWSKQADIDGYYVKDIDQAPSAFISSFSKTLKSMDPSFLLIGEINGQPLKKNEQADSLGLDLLVDRTLAEATAATFSGTSLPQKMLYDKWGKESNQPLANFLDDVHSTRFTAQALKSENHPGARTKQGLSYLYTSPSVPIVFYGTEIALNGGKGAENYGMINFLANPDIIDHLKKLSELRAKSPSLRKGSFTLVSEQKGVAVYKRRYKDETAFVVINNTKETSAINVPLKKVGKENELRGLITEGIIRPVDDVYNISLEPETTNVYKVVKKSGFNIGYIAAVAAVYTGFGIFLYKASSKRRKEKKISQSRKKDSAS